MGGTGATNGRGEAHRKGTSFNRNSGRRLDGDHVDGKADGTVRLVFPVGVYVGEVKEGAACGEGEATYTNGARYVGGWANGMRSGEGMLVNTDGSKYVGRYARHAQDGQGVLFDSEDNVVFQGMWKDKCDCVFLCVSLNFVHEVVFMFYFSGVLLFCPF
jgi:hypothetical protein